MLHVAVEILTENKEEDNFLMQDKELEAILLEEMEFVLSVE